MNLPGSKPRTLDDLRDRNIVVYDLEIEKPIEECSKGWDSKDEMGISCGVTYDYKDNRYHIYMADNMQDLVDRLNEDYTLIVAFNQISFDNELLRASKYNLKPDLRLRNYDMLRISRIGAGIGADGKHEGRWIGGFKLDDHLRALSLPMKTGDGGHAPILWRQGKIGQLLDYCMNDVTQERSLFEYMYTHGKVASGYNSNDYEITSPVLPELEQRNEEEK